jgi:hypothetical protein
MSNNFRKYPKTKARRIQGLSSTVLLYKFKNIQGLSSFVYEPWEKIQRMR